MYTEQALIRGHFVSQTAAQKIRDWCLRSSGMLHTLYWQLTTRRFWKPIGLIFKVGPIVFPETSVANHQSTLRDSPEQRRSHLHGGGSHAFMGHLIDEGLRHFPRNMTSKRRFPTKRGLIRQGTALYFLSRYSSETLIEHIYIYVCIYIYIILESNTTFTTKIN